MLAVTVRDEIVTREAGTEARNDHDLRDFIRERYRIHFLPSSYRLACLPPCRLSNVPTGADEGSLSPATLAEDDPTPHVPVRPRVPCGQA